MSNLPIACTLTPNQRRARGDDLLIGLATRALDRHELPAGYRFRFPPDAEMLLRITNAIIAERQCCRFLSFNIAAEADGGPVWLDVTGPAGTREFLSDLLAP